MERNEGQKSRGVPDDTKRGGGGEGPFPLPLPPFGVGVGVTVWCWCRRAAWVTGLAGPAVATHARVRIGASRARTHTPVKPAACVQRRRIHRTQRIIQAEILV